MTSRPDAAIQVPIGDVDESFIGLKIRTAGTILNYDVSTAFITLSSGRSNVKVDLQGLVMEDGDRSNDVSSLVKAGAKIFCLGTVDGASDPSSVTLSCLRIFDAHSLDLQQWEEAARTVSKAMHTRAASTKNGV